MRKTLRRFSTPQYTVTLHCVAVIWKIVTVTFSSAFLATPSGRHVNFWTPPHYSNSRQAMTILVPRESIVFMTTTTSSDCDDDTITNAVDEKFKKRNEQWVILVDDEEAIRMAVGDFLFNQGFQVTACADADSLLEVLQSEHDQGQRHLPDAIISDIRMPLSTKNGYELVEAIRSVPQWSSIPIIMLTAKAMTQDRVQGYKVGADAFLPKPFDPNELLSILDNVIARSKQSTVIATENGTSVETSSSSPDLLALKRQLDEIKEIMERNAASTVQKTNVVLTKSEQHMLQLVCDGCTYAEIAKDCDLTVKAVNRFVQKLYEQTDTKTRTELVKWAIQVGYVK
ncbi:diatom response regulator 1 [Nitzschia inconspicua]|uniref:Diatom response regulator 1 n=1 Tax=Nitzschia inconspicua TaxID=303405 RepID=A0A9K3LIK4_9STRA|nr:diatom response regulator 1 [Nitzschia inconspicua]